MTAPQTTAKRPRIDCPVCGKNVPITVGGNVWSHRNERLRRECRAAGLTPRKARIYAELLANDLAKLGTYWRIGDAPRVAQWLGVTYPPYVPSKEDAGCLDRELIGLVEHARQWITQTLRDHGIIP